MHPEDDYLRNLAEGRFMLQRSRATGQFFYPPRVAEPRTGSRELEWVAVSGRGVVYATTVVRKRPPEPNHGIVLVDLEEGPRMMSRVEGLPPEEVRIGMAVQAEIIEEQGRPLVIFRRSEGQ